MMYQTMALPLSGITGIGSALEKRLNRRGVTSVGDLLLHLPKDYFDDRQVRTIDSLQNGIPCRIQGRIMHKQARGLGRKRQVIIGLTDSSGQVRLNFFHSGYMMTDARLSEGREISVRGVAERWQGSWQMTHPDWCVAEQFTPGFKPVYGSLAGLSGKRVGTLIRQALKLLPVAASSPLDHVLKEATAGCYSLLLALKQLHAPDAVDLSAVQMATERLKSEEIIVYLYLMSEKRKQAECAAAVWSKDELSRKLLASLPYPLTEAQQQAWLEISGDLASGKRMHRLLQGDVGAGKTWVAALCMAKAAAYGRQAALLAPTEVLAQQHAQTLHELFSPLGLDITLLAGSTRARERRAILQRLQGGDLQLIVGTHALLSEDVVFNNLGLALVDEQHRFGVRQRWALTEKKTDQGGAVHLLAMTATPIPRSLALALYGDMDLSLMRGVPPGRKPVQTLVIATHRMKALAEGMQRILDDGGRIYWIVPRIDEDEDGISVDQRVELLEGYFPDASVSGLHGRMKSAAKTAVLDAFTSGDCRILVSTTVVEVGMNVLQARLMVIEQAELYGLAQLHQLRGRVGRAGDQGYCILIAGDDASQAALTRLKQMVDSHDGLELAEADLALRGGGDAIGTRQSGEAGFRLLDLAADAALIRRWHEKTPQFIADEAMLKFWRSAAESVD
jgi:ATP-dependent DNA helicase RecG